MGGHHEGAEASEPWPRDSPLGRFELRQIDARQVFSIEDVVEKTTESFWPALDLERVTVILAMAGARCQLAETRVLLPMEGRGSQLAWFGS